MTLFRETPGEFGNVSHWKFIGRYMFLLFILSLIHLLTPHFMYNIKSRNYEDDELIIVVIIITIIMEPLHPLISRRLQAIDAAGSTV